jgi:hypothetical protein
MIAAGEAVVRSVAGDEWEMMLELDDPRDLQRVIARIYREMERVR